MIRLVEKIPFYLCHRLRPQIQETSAVSIPFVICPIIFFWALYFFFVGLMKRRLVFSDDHQLSMIPGSSVISVNTQPLKVARQFELAFSAGETHYLTSDCPPSCIIPAVEHPKVESDPEAMRELDKCVEDLEQVCRDIELLEQELMQDG